MNSTRLQQLHSLIKRIISTELSELNHELFHSAAVTDVLLNNDGSECRVWIDGPIELVRKLNTQYHHAIQQAFKKKYPRKMVPRLHFYQDKGDMMQMDALLDQLEESDHDADTSTDI